jgi:hypothetical protein
MLHPQQQGVTHIKEPYSETNTPAKLPLSNIYILKHTSGKLPRKLARIHGGPRSLKSQKFREERERERRSMSSCGAAPSPATMSSKRGNLPRFRKGGDAHPGGQPPQLYKIEGLRGKWKEEFQ